MLANVPRLAAAALVRRRAAFWGSNVGSSTLQSKYFDKPLQQACVKARADKQLLSLTRYKPACFESDAYSRHKPVFEDPSLIISPE
jgi:hypothetical protein